MSIKTNLENASIPRFEAEILLAYVLGKDRTFLHAWPEKILTDAEIDQFEQFIARRLQGEPIAYILGEKEFWSLDFKITSDVLIPRPETEILIGEVLKLRKNLGDCLEKKQRLLDLGTGSGNIAITLAIECPSWEVIAVDYAEAALQLAKENAKRLNVNNIQFYKSHWYSVFLNKKTTFHIIVSNPPYIAKDDPHLFMGDCRFEPASALTDFEDGLNAYREIISGAKLFLADDGWLFLEHGFEQGAAIRDLMMQHGFHAIKTILDLAGHERVTICQK